MNPSRRLSECLSKCLLPLMLAAALLPPACAQIMPGMPSQTMPPPGKGAANGKVMPIKRITGTEGGGMAGMSMTNAMKSTTDLADPMSQEGSGTSWLPASSPMYGCAEMRGGNMLMLHGAIAPRYVNVGSKRGDRRNGG